jgi:RND superfamily putative drug exporter
MSRITETLVGHWTRWILLGLWLAATALAGTVAGSLHAVQDDRIVNYLPADAQSTQVEQLLKRFPAGQTTTAIAVLAWPGGLEPADRARIAAARHALAQIGTVGPVVPAKDGAAVLFGIALPDDQATLGGALAHIRTTLGHAAATLQTGITGPAAFAVDTVEALQGIDLKLLLAAGIVVAVVLLFVYRSPVLWLLPLASIGAALIVARAAVYALARYADLTVTGLSTGVLDVLVFGAGTDYALLLIARYREELPRQPGRTEAMARALRRAAPAIVASGSTVMLGLLCLLIATLNSDRGLGPVAAVGIFCVLVAALTLLPALFLVCGSWVFWPSRPRLAAGKTRAEGFWAGMGARLARRPRLVWSATVVILALAGGGLAGLHLGLPQSQSFVGTVPAVAGRNLLAAHFPASAEAPTTVIARAPSAAQVVQAINQTDGVIGARPVGEAGGLTEIAVILKAAPDSAEAHAAIGRLRDRLSRLPDAHALVGGPSAIDLDIAQAAAHDRAVVMPLVLAVVALVLGLLLRSLVAPLVLVATVVLSFAAALGVSSLAFDWGFGFAGVHRSVPLDTFIFLVALGIDYNIFLMTRARQEAVRAGTRTGMQRALALTGGVISSAGVVLAATFAVLALMPLVVLVQVGFTIAFGILLDTFVVRSILVPALVLDLGKHLWWPSRLG